MTATVRFGVLQGYFELVKEFSVDPATLLKQCHIDTALITDEDSRVALNSALKLLELSAAATHCEHFGLLLAFKQKSSFLGLIGLLMESAPDMESALRDAMRTLGIHSQGTKWNVSVEGEYACARYMLEAPVSVNPRQAIELTVGQLFQVLKTLSSNRWKPFQVCFRHQKPGDDWYFKHYFGVPVVFNCEFDGIYFRASDLKTPMLRRDERVYSALREYANLLCSDDKQDLCSQIKAAIRKLLPQGQCSSQNIAGLMACDKRTLQRLLKREGTSYQQLLDEVRYTMAQEHLRDSAMPLTNLAMMLGYTDVSTFSRSFKQQFGLPPSEWRKQYRQDRADQPRRSP